MMIIAILINPVFNELANVNVHKPSGHDNIPAKFYRACATELAPAFTFLINEIFKDGCFPENLKIANSSDL